MEISVSFKNMGSTYGNIRYKFLSLIFFVISTPTLIKLIPPLLDKNQTKHELSRATRALKMCIFILFTFRFACPTVFNFLTLFLKSPDNLITDSNMRKETILPLCRFAEKAVAKTK